MSARQPLLPDLDVMQQIMARLATARREEPRLAGAVPSDLIRHVKGKRAILRGQIDGRSAIFRIHLNAERGDAQREWDEMQRLWPHMSQGDLRIPEPICAAPESGVIVQEEVRGTPLMTLLYELKETERAAYLPPAAAWLRATTKLSEAWEPARPQRWIARAASASAQQPFEQLQRLESQILTQMERLAPEIEAAPWRTAICHGDYHPNNLIADGARLTGIDLGGSRRMPVAKDIARFAMHMGRRRLRLSGRTRYGVDAGCLAAFARAFEMDTTERTCALPFFLAFEALIRVETTALPPARIRRAEKTYHALLQDLKKTGAGRASD